MPDQAKSGNEAREDGARLCKECGEKPPMGNGPYCASCLQKRAVKARMKHPKASKRKKGERPAARPTAHSQGTPKVGTAAIRIDFGKHGTVLEEVVKLADEQMRPLETQIIFMLKTCLKRPGAAL